MAFRVPRSIVDKARTLAGEAGVQEEPYIMGYVQAWHDTTKLRKENRDLIIQADDRRSDEDLSTLGDQPSDGTED